LAGTTELFGSTVTDYRIFIIGFGTLLSIALFYVIERTRIGIVVRAASVNSAMVVDADRKLTHL
jgi:branched-chain amino acid transport system permease protein